MNTSCFIIEDEPLAQNILKKYIEQVPGMELIGVFNDAIEAQQYLHVQKPDILFLDINLPTMSGMNFLKTLISPPLIIFTTAYQDFAVEGFEMNAVDYLLKPFSFERFLKAYNKAVERLRAKPEKPLPDDAFVFIKVDKKLYRVATDEVYYLEALDDYVKVVTKQKEYLTNNTLKNLAEQFPESRFMRVHKSYIVCVGKIDYIEGNYIKILGKDLPVGAVYKDQLVALFKGKK